MATNELLQHIITKRDCGNVYLAFYEKPLNSEWEISVLDYFQTAQISVDDLRASLIKISTSDVACGILTELLHRDLAYRAEIMSLEKARKFATAFISLFSEQAVYFSNSTWNKNEYREAGANFELGQTSWNSFTEATFDSGLIICDTDKIGVAWFADED